MKIQKKWLQWGKMNTLKRRFIGGKRVIVNIKKMEHLNGKEGRVKAKK